jgi:hypothetical protein
MRVSTAPSSVVALGVPETPTSSVPQAASVEASSTIIVSLATVARAPILIMLSSYDPIALIMAGL